VILTLATVNTRPNLIVIKIILEAVSSYGSCHQTTFFSLPTPLPGHGGAGLSLEQLHAHPQNVSAAAVFTQHGRKLPPVGEDWSLQL